MRVRYTITFETRVQRADELVMLLRGLLKVAGRTFGFRCVRVGEEEIVAEPVRREPRDLVEGGVPGWRSREGQGRFWR